MLIRQLSFDELAVQSGDVGDGFALRADGFAGTGVRAVAETEFFHSHHHFLGATGGLGTTLRQQCQLADLRRYEEHGRAVLTSGDAGSATDAGGAVHCLVGILLRNEDGVGVLCLTCANRGVAAGLDNLVEGTAIDHTVLDHGEGCRAPRFDGDDVAIVEAAHIELAGGGTALGLAVGRAVDVERAHTADSFAAVVVEDKRLLALVDELFVEDVEHFEERGVVGDILHLAGLKMAFFAWAVLLPVLNCKTDILCHSLLIIFDD